MSFLTRDIIDLFFHNEKLIADWLFIDMCLLLQLISKRINSLHLNIYNLDIDQLWFTLKILL